mmetsp:Transcript_12778/g.27097  ORF Transcript_12778/g.27097 Transcript_12778/m.27097 type:complete len:226 (+) Transcript_12778:174-851(+)
MFKFQVDTEFGPTTLFSPTATDSLVGGWRVRSSCKQATVFKPGDWIPVPRSYPISHRLRPMLRLALSPRTNRERGTRNPCSPGAGNLRRDPSERRQTPSLPISSPEASTKTRATPWPWERIARATRLPGGNNRLPVANRSRCRPFPKNKRREPRPFWRPGPPAPAVTTTTTTTGCRQTGGSFRRSRRLPSDRVSGRRSVARCESRGRPGSPEPSCPPSPPATSRC